MPPSEPPSLWSFSMELLSHVHTLRIFVFHPSSHVGPDRDCVDLAATLLSAPPALSCTWSDVHHPHAASRHALRLPLPLLPFDFSASPRHCSHPNCIQLSIPLLPLPPSQLHAFLSLSIANDADGLESIQTDEPIVPRDSIICADGEVASRSPNFVDQDGAHKECLQDNTCGHDHVIVQDFNLANHSARHPYNCADINGNEGTPPPQHGEECRLDSFLHQPHDNDGSRAHLELSDITTLPSPSHVEQGHSPQTSACPHSSHNQNTKCRLNGETLSLAQPSSLNGHDEGQSQESIAPSDARGEYTLQSSDNSCQHLQDENVQNGKGKCLHNGCQVLPHDLEFVQEQQHDGHGACYSSCGSSLGYEADRLGAELPNDSSPVPSFKPSECGSLSSQGMSSPPSPQEVVNLFCRICCGKVSKNPIRNFVQLPCAGWRDVVENWFGACCCSFGSKAETLSANFERSLQLRHGKCLVGPSSLYVDVSDVNVDTEPSKEIDSSGFIQQPSSLSFLALGNGFMVWENEHSNSVYWLAVHCTGCASLIGAYPCKKINSGSIREGLHLFRCRITSKNADGTLYNGHRYSTFRKSLVKELHLRSDEDMSYRFLIRSLRTKKPLLQLVVLSYNSFLCMGSVSDAPLEAADGLDVRGQDPDGLLEKDCALRQSVKLMFLDCSNPSAEETRSAEQWVEDHDTETVYMLEELVGELKKELFANSSFCPATGGWSQNFRESFLSI